MKTDISLDALSVIMESANFNLDIGDNAKIDIGQAVDYIKSGEAEIEAAVQTKTAAFNLNAQSQITEFNTNALLQTQNFDNHIEESLNLAKQWAIGLPNEPEGNSAKYWAEQSALNLNNKQDKIPAGNAGEVVIYSGINGVVGSTTMPIVNDATLTIQKNSATVGSFTSNAVDDKIINISVPTQASDVGAQETLVSGINIKTINSNSLLESGDVKSHEIITSTISNCITEIPQDIKLELNDGILTLKAGSKVYVPNGFEDDGVTPKFDIITITNDLTSSGRNYDFTNVIVIQNGAMKPNRQDYVFSGSTTPTSPQNGYTWYDTTNNIIRFYENGVWSILNTSLPVAIVKSTTANSYVSIDQVFNGFGYIGSTVFALPNVKGLIPNGRNADGTLKSTEYTIGSVLTHTTTAQDVVAYLAINSSMVALAAKFVTTYKEKENYVFDEYVQANANWSALGTIMTDANAKITSFASIQPFHAVDYNDSSWVSAQAMPSSKYINLTLGATGSTYTAPANGWYTISKQGTSGQLAAFENTTAGGVTWITTLSSGTDVRISCPAKKGDNVRLWYSATGATHFFRFVYAEGEN